MLSLAWDVWNDYRGPDIPCFLKIEKWIMTKIRVRSGKTNVWMLYNLVKVDVKVDWF